MTFRLSKSNITSFCGDVLPLWLISDTDISKEKIKWSVSGKAVQMTCLSDNTPFSVNHGVLLTLKEVGEAVVTAEYKNHEYKCRIISREMKSLTAEDKICYFRGNFHDHTSQDHDPKTFPHRTTGLPVDYITKIKTENLLDCSTISDHAVLMTKKDLFETFAAVETAGSMDPVIFAGNESDVSVRETDRFGVIHKNGGEVVCINAVNYTSCDSWQEFIDAYKASPFAVGIFAHPQEMGGGNDGLWDFDFKNKYTPALAKLMKGIEVGNGRDMASNAVHEYAYSLALDAGFRLSTVSSCDHHGPNNWGFNAFPGKTIIMAYEKSKEAFVDALDNLRFYACESANIKLKVCVNGKTAPCELDHADTYLFDIDTSYFINDDSTIPVKCEVISDGGQTVKVIEKSELVTCSFEIKSDSAHYFYIRLTDKAGRRTWSPPVFTGRPLEQSQKTQLNAIDKSDFTATEILTDTNADVLINNNICDIWNIGLKNAEIVVDMKTPQKICALGVYHPRCIAREIKASGESLRDRIAGFVSGYEIYTSIDGKEFTPCAKGNIRVFGNEEIIPFTETNARFVRFCALSTVGAVRKTAEADNASLNIAELSIFSKA